MEFIEREKQFNTSENAELWQLLMTINCTMTGSLSIHDPQLSKASKELFNVKTETPFGLSMGLKTRKRKSL